MKRCLALVLSLCLLLPALAGQAAGYALVDVPETVDSPDATVEFTGEVGVEYSLHYKYRGIWFLPTALTLTDSTKGTYEVKLGVGQNDFVLTEAGQPRDGEDAIAFTIEYIQPGQATQTPSASPEPTAQATDGTQAPTATPWPTPTLWPTATPEPTPEPTEPPQEEAEPEAEAEAPTEPYARNIRLWAEGADVQALQEALQELGYKFGRVDGVYGPRTRAAVTRFQREHGLKVDGIAGVQVREALTALDYELPLYEIPDMTRPEGFDRDLSIGKEGMDVYALQQALIEQGYLEGKPDQVFGKKTRTAVRAFQADNGIKADGVAGPDTLRLLIGGATEAETAEDAAQDNQE